MAQSVNFDVTEVLNITCKKGDTFSMTLTLKDSSGTALSLATDGYIFVMQVKSQVPFGDKRSGKTRDQIMLATPASAKAKTNQRTTNLLFEEPTVDDSGNVTIEASAEIMSQMPAGSYVYDLQYIKPNDSGLDTHTTIIKGSFVINADVSEYF